VRAALSVVVARDAHGEQRCVLVVCAGCGDVRLVVPDAKALDALQDDRAYVFVELPQSGPFRLAVTVQRGRENSSEPSSTEP
jgi:predicted transglutaminase-like cysteine proteinase